MERVHYFLLEQEQYINELQSRARLWRCQHTDAQVLSLCNDDENKVFGAVLRTPPTDSTGVAHILEHSVLCGSRNFPVKEPFVELLKGSMQTFLNAFTFPDKTCYPVASTHPKDFYNLIRVYLDAVFFPRITEDIFKQEGWRLVPDPNDPVNGPAIFKGVVYNEMKGAYSSPDSLLAEFAQHSLFQDTTYSFDSGGDPACIPDLTYEQFHDFHARYYHPSNTRFFFSGDDPEDQRLALLREYIQEFDGKTPGSDVAAQPFFSGLRRVEKAYPAAPEDAEDDSGRAMAVCNWLLCDTLDPEQTFLMTMLEHLLIGLPASPLYKALIDSGLGDDVAGVGLEQDLKQMYFSVGLKGIREQDADEVERIIFRTLEDLVANGPDPAAVEAAVNSIEFSLRENNAGRFPRALHLMLRSLTTWLYDGDPFALLAFEAPLQRIKDRLAAGEKVFEDMIKTWLLENTSRTVVVLKPDPDLGEEWRRKEKERIQQVCDELGPKGLQQASQDAERLQRQQEEPDPPEALARIPRLSRADLATENTSIPLEELEEAGVPVWIHDLDAGGVGYLDLAFDMSRLEGPALAMVPLLGRALTDMSTSKREFVEFSTLAARKTGGVWADTLSESRRGSPDPALRLLLRAKAAPDKLQDMLDIVEEALNDALLNDKDRLRQIVLEEKARLEHRLIPSGHVMTLSRLRARFSRAGVETERMDGVTQLLFLRRLAKDVDADWEGVVAGLERLREAIVGRSGLIANVTMNKDQFESFRPGLAGMLSRLPEQQAAPDQGRLYTPAQAEPKTPDMEGLHIPAGVNYVGKAVSLAHMGRPCTGADVVAARLLRNSYLWDQVRVQGGAYGAFCYLNRFDNTVAMVSYRDPNLARTLEVFDRAAEHLANIELSTDEMDKAVIGAVSDIDAHMLPDAKGLASMTRQLTGDDDAARQQLRDQVLQATQDQFRELGRALVGFAANGRVTVLGGGEELAAEAAKRGWELQTLM